MPYSVKHGENVVEVEVWGQTSTAEVLAAINEIHAAYPRKERPDLWTLSREAMLPLSVFPTIVQAIKGLCGGDQVYRRSAIVASDRFQRAMADMYRIEAAELPFELGVFSSKDKAMEWLKTPSASPSGRG
jgi:hypothetical protein